MAATRIAIIGLGKISQDQHLPVIAANPDFELAAVVSQRGLGQAGVPTFATPAELFASDMRIDAVAICTPPHVRYAIARTALEAGMGVLLEKPPAQTVSELDDLVAHAARLGRVLFATWHSQYNEAVEAARVRLAGARLRRLHIEWKEDVRRWHPGQDWIWEVGGFGVFDPGINALSILTRIMPAPVFIGAAALTYPSNRAMPIAAHLDLSSPAGAVPGAVLDADFDWRQTGEQTWAIEVETEEGQRLDLVEGGSKLLVDGSVAAGAPMAEYQGIYRRFAELLREGRSDVDSAPFRLVADAFLTGRRLETEPFVE